MSTQDETATAAAGSRSTLALLRLGFLVAMIVGAFVAFAVLGTDGVRDLLESAGNSRWGAVAFIAIYAITVILLLPGTVGTLAAGAVFGFPFGGVVALAGATIGATGSFFISRFLGREGAQQIFGTKLNSLDEWIGDNDFVSILILRLMPLVPFNLLNYGSGLTSVRPSRYVVASLVGMAPATFLGVAVAASASEGNGALFIGLLVAFVGLIVVTSYMGKRVKANRAAAA